ncbi:hypothetical protein MBAV_003987 [Candidatus Magnetobacterium bavaricum]|uniref:Uncharacterized protein n=1 Tax=Candidatus Magnetobacterium bavaricum TaxID=29290 RepID=A0A0F3GPU7_9BACT|nr:hypothetical protein MBAV_003987 [Candidatus Magnetobacterium bavaricum]
MTVKDILQRTRQLLTDNIPPYLWSDAELVDYLNDAINELLIQTRLLIDSATPDICRIDVSANVNAYALDKRVIALKRVVSQGTGTLLVRVTQPYMDALNANWEQTTGSPRNYLLDATSGYLTLYPTPDKSDTLRLTVYRLPINELTPTAQDLEPEVNYRYHPRLIAGILCRAYEKTDTETFNPTGGQKYNDIWHRFIEDVKKDTLVNDYVDTCYRAEL